MFVNRLYQGNRDETYTNTQKWEITGWGLCFGVSQTNRDVMAEGIYREVKRDDVKLILEVEK